MTFLVAESTQASTRNHTIPRIRRGNIDPRRPAAFKNNQNVAHVRKNQLPASMRFPLFLTCHTFLAFS